MARRATKVITFQVTQVNPIDSNKKTHLHNVEIDADEISGTDTVRNAKRKIVPKLNIGSKPCTWYFGGDEMMEDALFYADHYILLPAWVQVYVL